MTTSFRDVWRTMLDLWPIVIALIGIIVGGAKVYFTVEDNSKTIDELSTKLETRMADHEQWRQIRDARDRLKALETWREKIDELTQPTEVQEWGWIKQQVRENQRRIGEHVREDH